MFGKKDLTTLLKKAQSLRERGDVKGALKILDDAIERYPNQTEPYTNKGAILLMLHMPDEACSVIERAITLDPRNGPAHNNLGWCYRLLGRFEDAITQFELAISNGYSHEGVYYNLGVTQLNLGRSQEAMDNFITSLRINPSYGPLRNDLGKLGRMFSGIDEPTTVSDLERIKAALKAAGNPTIL